MYGSHAFHPKGAMNSKKHLFLGIKEERERRREGGKWSRIVYIREERDGSGGREEGGRKGIHPKLHRCTLNAVLGTSSQVTCFPCSACQA